MSETIVDTAFSSAFGRTQLNNIWRDNVSTVTSLKSSKRAVTIVVSVLVVSKCGLAYETVVNDWCACTVVLFSMITLDCWPEFWFSTQFWIFLFSFLNYYYENYLIQLEEHLLIIVTVWAHHKHNFAVICTFSNQYRCSNMPRKYCLSCLFSCRML